MKKKIIISLCAGAMTMLSSPALAQNQMIKGTVVDETGEPIIGATVKVAGKSGTGAGTITDIDGNYSISVPKGGKVVITYIGYLPLTTAPGGKVALQEDEAKFGRSCGSRLRCTEDEECDRCNRNHQS